MKQGHTPLSKKAFTLVESALILLLIGILVAGITQGNRLIKQSRVRTAQTLTKNSPVSDIPGLFLWYETSLEDSFKEAERKDGESVSTWLDNNIEATVKNNATQNTAANQPKFYENVFNGSIPALRFDGSNDFMNFDGSGLVNAGYTIFVVEQRRGTGSGYLPFIGGDDNSSNQNLVVGYLNNTKVIYKHCCDSCLTGSCSNSMIFTVPGYSSPTSAIHTFSLNTSDGRKYWLNGTDTPDASNATFTDPLTAFTSAAIGRYNYVLTYYFSGDLGEIIIFNRPLKSEERKSIELYLSRKYGINLS